jgi:hypothetical protein
MSLGPHDSFALGHACIPIRDAFATPYLVGSVFTRRDPRDIDVRVILPDDDAMLADPGRRDVVEHAITAHLTAVTGLPIDFQFQSTTEAAQYTGRRSALGLYFPPEQRRRLRAKEIENGDSRG